MSEQFLIEAKFEKRPKGDLFKYWATLTLPAGAGLDEFVETVRDIETRGHCANLNASREQNGARTVILGVQSVDNYRQLLNVVEEKFAGTAKLAEPKQTLVDRAIATSQAAAQARQ